MKLRIITFALFFSASLSAFSQGTNSCIVNNAGFELGNITGWICKYGYYGAAPCPPTGTCPRMGTVYTNSTQLNPGGINAPLTPGGNRHTITTGTGMDPNSTNLVPVVAPGGGTYSLRLGDGATGTVNGTNAQAEAIRLTFAVTNQNASFTYRYAFFVNNPGHAYESQPSFEVVVLDQSNNIIPCGRYFVVAGNYPSCVNASGFTNGSNGYVFKNWTDVGLDLTGYIGQNISIEFRTTDCDPSGGGSSTSCGSNVCTYCVGGACCTYAVGQPQCTPSGGGCSYSAGNHSAYAYIDAYCAPLSVQSPSFCAGASSVQICAPAGYVSYDWPAGQPGMGGAQTTQCVTITNPVAGATYTVNMVSATGCPTSTIVTLQGAAVNVNSATICGGIPTTLTATGGTGYSWSTGSTTDTIVVAPSVTTTYTVTAQSGSCTATGTATVTVGTIAASISPDVTLCPGDSTVIATSGGGTYAWSTGATTDSITVMPTGTTAYSVTVTNGACQAVGSMTVTVSTISASVTPSSTTICNGALATLAATGGTAYSWSTGQTTANISVTPTATTNYTVIVSNGNCADTAFTTVNVNTLNANVGSSGSICAGNIATLTATGGGTYSWSDGSTASSITVSPSTTTNYWVVVTNGNCSTTLNQNVIVSSLVAGTNNPSPICVGGTTTLTAGGGTLYSWSTGSTNAVITVTPTTTTVYTVTVSDGNCASTTSVTVQVNPKPNISASAASICAGSTATIIATGGITYSWNTGSNANPLYVPGLTSSTTYTVTGTDGNGCTNTSSTTVNVVPLPVVTAGPTSTICLGKTTASLQATGGGTYSWVPGTGLSCTNCANPVASPNSSQTYTVYVSNGGCSKAGTVSVTVGAIPYVSAIAPTTICTGDSATLYANVSNVPAGQLPVTWYWSPPNNLNNPTLQNPTAGPVGTTTYVVTVTDAYGCKDDTSTVVYVQTVPTVTWAQWDPTFDCEGYVIPFKANVSSNGQSVYWSFGDGTNATTAPPNTNPDPHAYPYNGTYVISVTVFNKPCKTKLDTTITVGDMTQYMNILEANVFTPNGDTYNDCFHPAITLQSVPSSTTAEELRAKLSQCIELEVYDRWGIKMFTSTDDIKCWDGKTKGGTPAKQGTYYYIAKFKEVTLKGFVELLR